MQLERLKIPNRAGILTKAYKLELNIDETACLTTKGNPVQCEFSGMNRKFLQTQTLTSVEGC